MKQSTQNFIWGVAAIAVHSIAGYFELYHIALWAIIIAILSFIGMVFMEGCEIIADAIKERE